jgi:hypothetical protein
VEKMEVVHLGEGGVIVDTCLRDGLLKVAVDLNSILGGAKIGVNGVGATSGCGVIQFDILARSGHLGNGMQILLHFCQLNVKKLLQGGGKMSLTIMHVQFEPNFFFLGGGVCLMS